MNLQGRTALVTGASSGIGASIARELAKSGASLVLTARRADRLDALATELRASYGTEVMTIPLDLGESAGPRTLFEQTEGKGTQVDILINNAGFGTQGKFQSIPWEKTAEQVQLNIVSLTELTHRFLAPMIARRKGHVLNVASIGAYIPTPSYATYAAGKAYVRNFTEALAVDLRRTGVHACCLCPGGTRTEFLDVAGQKLTWYIDASLMSADRCARIGLAALFGGRRLIVAGWANSIMCWSLRFVPRRLVTWAAGLVMAKG